MAMNKYILGLLTLVILTSSIYILMPEKVRIDFQPTRNIFYVYINGTFELSAKEYVRVFDGTTLMKANDRQLWYRINTDNSSIYKSADFKNGIRIKEQVYFNNNPESVENVPVYHKVCFTNATGKIFEYLITDITYSDETKSIVSPFSFGKRMKLYFQEGYYYAKVTNNKVSPDKIQVKYKISSDYECFNVRLFDPIPADLAEWTLIDKFSDNITWANNANKNYGVNNKNFSFHLNTTMHQIYINQTAGYLKLYSYQTPGINKIQTAAVWLNYTNFDLKNNMIYFSKVYMRAEYTSTGGPGACIRVMTESNISQYLANDNSYAYGINLAGACDSSDATWTYNNVTVWFNNTNKLVYMYHDSGTLTANTSKLPQYEPFYLVHMATARANSGAVNWGEQDIYDYYVNTTTALIDHNISIDFINATSCFNGAGYVEEPYLCNDATPTIKFNTTNITYCRISNSSYNSYSSIPATGHICTSSNLVDHTCILPSSDTLPEGISNIFVACLSNNNYTTLLQFSIDTIPPSINNTSPTGGMVVQKRATLFDLGINDSHLNRTIINYYSGGLDACYQETATTSTICGGLDTGTYRTVGSFHGSFPSSNAIDGNWATYTVPPTSGAHSYIYVNYTIPQDTVNAIWSYKGGRPSVIKTGDVTIPYDCLDNSVLSINISLDCGATSSIYSCLNYSNSQYIFLDSATDGYSCYFWEEGINWFTSNNTQLYTNPVYVALDDGNITLSVTSYDNYGNSAYKSIKFKVLVGNLSLFLDGLNSDRYYELGTTANITFNHYLDLAGLSIDYDGYTGSGLIPINKLKIINYSYNNGTLYYSEEPSNKTIVLFIHSLDEFTTFNFSWYSDNVNDSYPSNIKMYLGNITILNYNNILISDGVNDLFSNGKTQQDTLINCDNCYKILNITIPKSATVNNATLNITGRRYYPNLPIAEYDYFNDLTKSGNIWTQELTYWSGGGCNPTRSITFDNVNSKVTLFSRASTYTSPGGTTYHCTGNSVRIKGNKPLNYYYLKLNQQSKLVIDYSYDISNNVYGSSGYSFYLYNSTKSVVAYQENFGGNRFDSFSGSIQINVSDYDIGGDIYLDIYDWASTSNSYSPGEIYLVVNDIYQNNMQPINVSIYSGSLSGTNLFNKTGIFNQTNTSASFKTDLTTFLLTCDVDDMYQCTYPLYIYSLYGGNISANALNLNYSSSNENIAIDPEYLNDYLSLTENENATNITLKLESKTKGLIYITNLSVLFDGERDLKVYSYTDEEILTKHLIFDCTDLQDMQTDLEGDYYLVNNIDCSATSTWNGGLGFEPIGNSSTKFTGTFNGNGYNISNLFINRSNKNYVGLFGYIQGNNLNNLNFINVTIYGSNYTGSLVGSYESSSGLVRVHNITNIHIISGVVIGANNTGGIIGKFYGNKLNILSNNASVTCIGKNCGGIVGYHYYTLINNSYNTGNISGTDWVGGISGYSYSSIYNSYNTGYILGTGNYVGGISGQVDAFFPLKNSFSIGGVTGSSNIGSIAGGNVLTPGNLYWYNFSGNPSDCYTSSNTGCTAVTDIDYFKNYSNAPISSFDFVNSWSGIYNNISYPILNYTTHSDIYVKNVYVRYSPFNISINPRGISYWDISPNIYSLTQNNVYPYGNANGNGNPFWSLNLTKFDHNTNIYVKYNESVNSCAVTRLSSSLGRNVIVNSTAKMLISNQTLSTPASISSLTNLSCSSNPGELILPIFCFYSLCNDCVHTYDAFDGCEVNQ